MQFFPGTDFLKTILLPFGIVGLSTSRSLLHACVLSLAMQLTDHNGGGVPDGEILSGKKSRKKYAESEVDQNV